MPERKVVLITGASSGVGQSTARLLSRRRRRALDAVRGHEERGPGPDVIAEALLRIVSSEAPRLRHLIGHQARSVARLRRFLPARMYEQGLRRTFSLDEGR
jgi:NAD(P)-dependent dehydrogenase (short-subunit alcohol dehydrogenase family)